MFKLHSKAFKKLKLLIIISFTFFICITDTNQAFSQSSSNIDSSENLRYALELLNHEIKIGVRTAAYPIGHDVKSTSAEGFCGVFGRELKKELKKYDSSIEVKYDDIENEYNKKGYDRFDGIRNGNVNIECGPNSEAIHTDNVAEEIDFSIPFYETGIKLLMKKSLIEKINQSSDINEIFKNLKIATIRDTTTNRKLSYSHKLNYDINLIDSPFDTRKEALEHVLDNDNTAYASDAPILASIIKRGIKNNINSMPNSLFKDYGIFPEESEKYLTQEKTEKYVIAIKDDPALKPILDVINWVLNEDKNPSKKLKASKKEIEDFTLTVTTTISYNNPDPIDSRYQPAKDLPNTKITTQKKRLFDKLLLLINYLGYVLAGLCAVIFISKKVNFRKVSKIMKENEQNNHQTNKSGNNNFAGRDITVINHYSQDISIEQDIEKLLKQLSQNNPNDSPRVIAAKAVDKVEKDPNFKLRVKKSLEAGTFAALKAANKHPAFQFFIEGIKEMIR